MLAIFETIFVLALLAIVPVYIMYFTALHYFGRALADKHPDIYARLIPHEMTGLSGSYLALQALQKDKPLLATLNSSVQDQFQSTYRYLLIGMSGFMVMLFAGLASAVISKA
ncbi:hypothetical protein [Stenotrophomonas maltophilia]|uniref:hypothetical protein n=1 Tax=Stenotrophomonas maltophilia TaxID=40324 RepID=UPI0021BEC43D|nr:hypothetical protein [Stenotrophomonas maltophilia]UXL29813.1 hypothetical protein N0O74_03090 [Stenotrophomonas maltophilia]